MTPARASPEVLAALTLFGGALARGAVPAGRISRALEPLVALASLALLVAVPRLDPAMPAAMGFAVLIAVICLASSLAGTVATSPDPSRRAIRGAPLATAGFAVLAVATRDPACAVAALGAASLSGTVCLAAGQGSASAQSCHRLARVQATALAIGLLGCLLWDAASLRGTAPPDAGLLRASASRLVPLACLALAGASPFGWALGQPARHAPSHLAALALVVPAVAGDLLLVRTQAAFPDRGSAEILAVLGGAAGLFGLLLLIAPDPRSGRSEGYRLPALLSLGLLALGSGPGGVRALLVWLPVVALLGQALLLRPAGDRPPIPEILLALALLPAAFLLLRQVAGGTLPIALACVILPLAVLRRPAPASRTAPAGARARTLLHVIALAEILVAAWLAVAMPRTLSDPLLDDATALATGSAR